MDTVIGVKHPLMGRVLEPIRHWSEWKERFESARTAEEMLGLLSYGLRIQPENPCDAFSFYLELAYGHAKYDYFKTDDPERFTSPLQDKREWKIGGNELRTFIAQYAWKMLGEYYFEPQKDEEGEKEVLFYGGGLVDTWSPVTYDKSGEQFLEQLLGFFDPEKMESNIPSDTRSTAGKFTSTFARWLLRDHPYTWSGPINAHEASRRKIYARKEKETVRAIQILRRLGTLEGLRSMNRFANPHGVLEALQETACTSPFRHEHKRRTFEEALSSNDSTAVTYMVLNARFSKES
ncbi:MAG: hypothetical protein ABA06_04060 [Parcubacteria bacterium C7867-001]|nr:MAG: hypothetical protein ABA06_04060 [Parcubacteria bacterium C7867-001]